MAQKTQKIPMLPALAFLVIGLIVGAVVGYLLAPRPAAPAAPAAPEYTFYYVSHGGPADPWWAPVIKGSQDAAALLNVKVVYSGPEKFSIQALVDLLNSAIAARPQGIILTITDYKALDEPARRAIGMGIPVIAVNVPDPRPEKERIPYITYIGQNEYDAGYYLAKYLVDKGYKPKRVVIGIHEVGHVGLETRAQGITDAIKKAYPDVPVEKLDITTDPTKAAEAFRSYLTAHPETDAIFTLGPLGAHPALQVLREMKLTGKVRLLTVDIDDVILKAIEAGELDAAVSQQPYAQGFLPVVFMYLYVKYGIMPPAQVPTGPTVIDKAKLDLVKKQIATTGGA
ncbi:MAG: sugar ABC transporter substrate-binding protein [Thermofilum sp.]